MVTKLAACILLGFIMIWLKFQVKILNRSKVMGQNPLKSNPVYGMVYTRFFCGRSGEIA